MILFRTLVRITIPTLAVLDIAYTSWWATAAGNLFLLWTNVFLLTAVLACAMAASGDTEFGRERTWYRTWSVRLYLLVSLLLSPGAGWWWCVACLAVGWLAWALAREMARETDGIRPHHQHN